MTSDLEVTGYATLDALDRYMWGSAAVIGLQVLPVLGTARGVPRAEAEPYAIALGEAFQLTNFLRDVGEDVDRGRVYLPARPHGRARGHPRAAGRASGTTTGSPALMREMVAVVRRRYDDAAPGTALLAPESRDCVRAATALYGGILRGDRAGRLPGARPPGVGVEAAPPGGVRPPVDRRPAGQGQGDHREAEEQVLDRRVGDPRPPDRARGRT